MFTSDEVGRLLDELEGFESSSTYDSLEASLIRVTRQDWEKARRSRRSCAPRCRAPRRSRSRPGPKRARTTTSRLPAPSERNLELRYRYIDCFDAVDEPYDILLDDFERGMKTAEVRRVFERLKDEQVKLVSDLAERSAELGNPLEARHSRSKGRRASSSR